ncbi:MAG: serpin family protein [Myxococcales bacterium]|nr:serpin family protein [Myxococcales bacterium]
MVASRQRSVALLALSLLAGCGTSSTDTVGTTGEDTTTGASPPPLEALAACGWESRHLDIARETSDTTPEELHQHVADGWAFATTLFHQLALDEPGNLTIAPTSLRAVFGMVEAAAAGVTRDELRAALRFTLPDDRLHAAFNRIDATLASRNLPPEADGESFVALTQANRAWVGRGALVDDAYLELLARSYGAGVELADFYGAPEPCREVINWWVEASTKGLIKELLPEMSVTKKTKVVLTNALYLGASWAERFEPGNTAIADFHRLDGVTVQTPMMNKLAAEAMYAEGVDYQALELPLHGHQLGVVLILPSPGQHAAFEAGLDGARLEEIFDALGYHGGLVRVPKFSTRSKLSLEEPLRALGLSTFFDQPMLPALPEIMEVTGVFHSTYLAFDEDGVEAAAASAIILGTDSGVNKEFDFIVDRPFFALIREHETGELLFFARIMDPTQ